MASIFGRQVIVPLTNKSGGSVVAGDVVIVDTGNNAAFTTTTSGGSTVSIGIAQETIANNATGRVLISGYAGLVNVNASVTRGNYGKTHTVAKQATDAGASRTTGTFCQFLTGGTTPTAMMFPVDQAASGGGTPVLRLDFNLAADVSNQAITAGTFFDLFANQNFTVGSASSLIEVLVRGYGFENDSVASQQFLFRANIDSGGTPVLKYFSTSPQNTATNERQNILIGGGIYLSGLSAATHTLKMQITSSQNTHIYCRASTNGPTTGGEFLAVQVIEHV